jgi:Flp pilus assembly protein TadD
MRYLAISLSMTLLLTAAACMKEKPKPLVPLPLSVGVAPQAATYNTQGTQAYKGAQFAEAKDLFAKAVAAAPTSAHAHYNLALAMNALGETDEARQHFIEAANLAPGDKVIWDSPALRPYGNPEAPKQIKEHPYATSRPTIGSGPR